MFLMIIIVNLAVGHNTQELDQYRTWEKCEHAIPAVRQRWHLQRSADTVCIPTHR